MRPRTGKAVRERFVALAAGLVRKHGLSAFEMPKRAAAIHEAGHVVINSVLGVRTTNVLIDPITRGGKLFWIGYTDAPKLAFVDSPASPVGFDEILARSRITTPALPQNCFSLAMTGAKVRRSTKSSCRSYWRNMPPVGRH